MDSEDRITKMRTVAKERFGCHPHSSVWFLDRALEWFNDRVLESYPGGDGCFRLQCSDNDLWIATFMFVYDSQYDDEEFVESEICWSGEGDSALTAIVELLWDMRGHA